MSANCFPEGLIPEPLYLCVTTHGGKPRSICKPMPLEDAESLVEMMAQYCPPGRHHAIAICPVQIVVDMDPWDNWPAVVELDGKIVHRGTREECRWFIEGFMEQEEINPTGRVPKLRLQPPAKAKTKTKPAKAKRKAAAAATRV